MDAGCSFPEELHILQQVMYVAGMQLDMEKVSQAHVPVAESGDMCQQFTSALC